MVLITGGAYQGKTDIAVKRLCIPREDIVDGENCAVDDVFGAAAVRRFECLVRRVMSEKSRDIRVFAREICEKNPSITVIVTEIGSGIVPLDREERDWREETGRACCVLAEFADLVIRVTCGIPTAIKGVML